VTPRWATTADSKAGPEYLANGFLLAFPFVWVG